MPCEAIVRSFRLSAQCCCNPDGVRTDPELGTCDASAQIAVLVTMYDLFLPKDPVSHGNVTLLFTNEGDELLQWELQPAEATDVIWTPSPPDGSLAGCEFGKTVVTVMSKTLQSRNAPYITRLKLTSNSLQGATRTILIEIRTRVSAIPSASHSTVRFSDDGPYVASSSVHFEVVPFDATGMQILDPPNMALSATLRHESNMTATTTCLFIGYEGECLIPSHVNRQHACDEARAAVELLLSCCRVGYDSASKSQAGSCQIPSRVNRQRACDQARAAEVECGDSPPVGEFTLEIKDTHDMLVGTRNSFFVAICPNDYYLSSNVCYLCPYGTVCPKGTTLETLQILPGRWRSGVCILSCRSIVIVTVVVCLRKFNHPIIGYLNNDCSM